jgi:hypothetical protein
MKRAFTEELEMARRDHPLFGRTYRGDRCGYFDYRGLSIIASDGAEWPFGGVVWEHVSVSRPDRCPTWDEMCRVKRLFWEPDECVVQFHPPESEYVNVHRHCLHLWKPVGVEVVLPPSLCVGPKAEVPA